MAIFRKFLYITILSILSTSSWAQSDVVVDMSVLKDYAPPPMFSEGVGADRLNETQQFKISNQTTNKSYRTKTPPVPKRRPSVFNASASFIQEIREAENMAPITADKIPVITEQPKGLPGPGSDAMDITADPLTRALSSPSAADVFHSIKKQDLSDVNTGPDISLYVRKRRARELGDDVQIISLAFGPAQTEINETLGNIMGKKALAILRDEPDLRVEVQAFAETGDQGQSSARRIALSRAINIRAFLIEQNVNPKRIDLRALGNSTEIKPVDRVDLLFLDPANSL